MVAKNTPLSTNPRSGGLYSVADNALTTGNVFWVDSGKTTAGGITAAYGKTPDAPFLTISAAISTDVCTANNGDLVIVMPGHAETVATAGALTLDIAGVTIIGIGDGAAQPTITLTDAASTIVVSGASVVVENFNLIANDDDVLICFQVNATDFTCRGCRFTGAAATKNFHACFTDAGANESDRMIVEDCVAILTDAANTHFVNWTAAQDGCIVRRNLLMGDWATMCIGGAGVVTFATIVDNDIANADNANDGCVSLDATATGICARNMGCAAAAQGNGFAATALALSENYYGVVSEDLSAILDPAGG